MTFASRLARAVLALAVSAGAIAFQATPAAAWANNGDGYSTHDWIVDQAVRVLDGRADGWFDAQIARLSSDDPDTIERPIRDQNDHVYHERGRRGGGVDRIATEFDKASASYAAGDYDDASYHIGLLAHIYGDLLQPYHTAYAAMRLDERAQELPAAGREPDAQGERHARLAEHEAHGLDLRQHPHEGRRRGRLLARLLSAHCTGRSVRTRAT